MERFRTNFTAACIRAARTAIQGVIAALGTMALFDIDWVALVNVVGGTTLMSFLTGLLTALPEVNED